MNRILLYLPIYIIRHHSRLHVCANLYNMMCVCLAPGPFLRDAWSSMLLLKGVLFSFQLCVIFKRGVSLKHAAYFKRQKGVYLRNHVITTKYAEREMDCCMYCTRLKECSSVNYKFAGVRKGLCELNNQTISDKTGISDAEFVYIEVVHQINQKINQLNNTVVNQTAPKYKECFGYQWLTESNRNQKYYNKSTVLCDGDLSTGWYRFGGGAGTKMATKCVPEGWRCGTHAGGWLNTHPTVAEGKVTRKVCYHYRGSCCYKSNDIEVVNCGLYYVYKLTPPVLCSYRYCGSDN